MIAHDSIFPILVQHPFLLVTDGPSKTTNSTISISVYTMLPELYLLGNKIVRSYPFMMRDMVFRWHCFMGVVCVSVPVL